jgi:nitrogenase molybdenum-iron protein beta chain
MSTITEYPRGSCVLGGVNTVLNAVNRVCPIYHSGPGCCMQTSGGEANQAGLRNPFYIHNVSTPCSNMLEREVIFGGEEKLRGVIDGSLEIIDADAYFVLTGCTAGIIGEDVLGVTKDYAEKGYPVYPITTPGFAGNSLLGYEVAFQAFIDHIVQTGLPHQSNLVNLWGVIPYHDPHWSGTLEELTRVLRRLGLQVNTFFTENQDIETIRTSSSAALNIIVNPWLLEKAAKQYEEKFGVPTLRFPELPIGATETSRFIRAVGEALGLDVDLIEKVIHSEESYVYNYFETIIGVMSWKQFAVVADSAAAIGFTRFLANDYSFTPVLTIVSEPLWSDNVRNLIINEIKNLEYAKPPEIAFISDHYEIRQKIKEHPEITLLLGSTLEQETAQELGIQCHVMTFPMSDRLVVNRTYAGYRGCLTLIEDLYNNL